MTLVVEKAGQRQAGGRKNAVIDIPLDERGQEAEHFLPCQRHGDAETGHLSLNRRQPGRIRAKLAEQPVAAAHRPIEFAGASAMLRIERKHQPIEEPPPVGRRPGEEPIHRWRQPENAQVIRQFVDG
ncbi:hypothetical protein D9M72_530790 [compost metagenome]